jgi:hypothetical protein
LGVPSDALGIAEVVTATIACLRYFLLKEFVSSLRSVQRSKDMLIMKVVAFCDDFQIFQNFQSSHIR